MARDRFPSPFEVETPAGAEGWEGMYNWYHLFGDERRQMDEQRFWFQDRLHHPGALYPYDEIQCECWWHALGAFNTRIFSMPPALGVDQRILNGYLYVTPVPVPDPEDIPKRAEVYQRRAGHYYENWDAIYEEWKEKVTARFEELKAMEFAPLPDLEEESVVFDHVGSSTGYRLLENFYRMVLIMYETYQWHFEMLNIGYAAYLTLFGYCKEAFPDITDQAISRMVGGLRVDLYRPDDELKRLAREAERLGVGDVILESGDPAAAFAELGETGPGREWLADWDRTSDPWFRVATDPGHPGGYHVYKTWLEDQGLPLAFVREYIQRIRTGEEIDRSTDEVLAERNRISSEYRELLAPDDREGFDRMVELARTVFTYIEDHVLYIEHWIWSTFWAKSRELARALVDMGYLDDPEDMFFLRRYEVMEALYDLVTGWAVGSRSRGPEYWRPIIAKRRRIYDVLRDWDALPALGPPPAEVTEPFTVLLWGITTDTVREWLAGGETGDGVLKGVPGSPGVAEGPARVVRDVSELDQVEEGDILVCPATSPAWSPVFARIKATVSDVGGIMSHCAIVCREYGLPAVVGTGNAVATIKTGQRVRVDGDTGTVTVLG